MIRNCLFFIWPLCFIANLVVCSRAAELLPLAETMQRDAALLAVDFVTPQRGWAVGHRGTIWHTTDGGSNWNLQTSGSSSTLSSVSFADAQRGWAVGGQSVPYTQRSQAVVLRTLDGGVTWLPVPTPTLPRLIYVKFFDAAHGIVVGESSAMYPSGAFKTEDGGLNWTPLSTTVAGRWRAAVFTSLDNGVLVDERGAWAQYNGGTIELGRFASESAAPTFAIAMSDDLHGWRVGGNTFVQATHDGGTTWQSPTTPPLSRETAPLFDATAVATIGPHVWIAGAPGTRVFHSADGGESWQAAATPIRTPIRGLEFVDERRGWAIGELGTILATTDGGVTWTPQRRGGEGAAIWLATPATTMPPLELVAHAGAADGLFVASDNLLSGSSLGEQRSLAEALVECGATSSTQAWQFQLNEQECAASTAESLLERLSARSDGKAAEWLTQRAVVQLLMWRPTVVVVPHSVGEASCGADQLIEQIVLRAIEQTRSLGIEELGLAPNNVKRVVGLLGEGRQGTIVVPTSEFASSLSTTPEEYASVARGLVSREHIPPPPFVALELIDQQAGLAPPRRDVTTGLFVAPGGGARRMTAAAPIGNLQELKTLAQRRKHLVRLLDYSQSNPGWSAQVVNMTGGLRPEAGGLLMFQLAEGYRATGRLDLAADTYYLLAHRYPDHPLVEKSLAWLINYYASSEVAHVASMATTDRVDTRPLANFASRDSSAAALANPNGQTSGLNRDDRFERARRLGEYIRQARPALAAEPETGTALAIAQRGRGFAADADRFFLMLGKSSADDAWRRVARAERWLAEPAPNPPDKPIATCKFSGLRPHLDGQLHDEIWSKARTISFGDKANSRETRIWLACDTEFLFIAADCPRVTASASTTPTDSKQPRTRDADLTAGDRLCFSLDTDRDYRCCYELTVDHRGQTHDACWGDKTWNPKWYVAQAETGDAWQIELAISWSELVPEPPSLRAAWAINIRRQNPSGPTTNWPAATTSPPDNLGLLLFE